MKRLVMIAAVACAMAAPAGLVWAQEDGADAPKPKPAKRPKAARPEKKRSVLRGTHLQMVKVCGLSEDQVKSLEQIELRKREDLKPLNEKAKPIRERLNQANKDKDKEAVKAARAEMAPISKQMADISRKAWTGMLAVLTPEQKATWDQYMFVRGVKSRFSAAKVTDEQVEKVKAAYVKGTAGVDMADNKARNAAMGKLYQMIENEILTPEQRTDYAVARVTRRYRRLNLSDDQKAQIRDAYLKSVTGLDTSDRKVLSAADRKLQEQIRTEILNDQQRAKVKAPPTRGPAREKPAKPAKPAEVAKEPADE